MLHKRSHRLIRLLAKVKDQLMPRRSVRIGRFEIETTPNHPLRTYLHKHPLYDRFLPLLCKTLQGTVIDIGANIGDSMAAILDSSTDLKIICVEPDDCFHAVLERNRAAIDEHHQVTVVKAFVGSSGGGYTIVKNRTSSTGHIAKVDAAETSVRSLSFAELLSETGVPAPALVKSDTDGFDANILAGIASHVQSDPNCRPLIFFEMQTYLQEQGFSDPNREARQRSYMDAISRLGEFGYGRAAIFDNYGTPIARSADPKLLDTLHDYICCSQVRNQRAAIYFFDVLLYRDQDAAVVESALQCLLRDTRC